MEHFELNEKNFPLRRMIVNQDGEEIEWIISTESLNQEIELYGHRSFTADIIDDTVIFYVPDDILFSDCVVEGIENPESYGINKIFSFDDYEFELSDLEIIEKILDLWIGKFSVLQTEIGYVVTEFE